MSKGDRSKSDAVNFGLNESLSKHLKFSEEYVFKEEEEEEASLTWKVS